MLVALFISYNAESFGFDQKMNGSPGFVLYVYCWLRKHYEKNDAILSDFIQEF